MDNQYIIYRLDEKTDVDGQQLLPGYYRFTYNLSEPALEHQCQYSTDRDKWTDCELFKRLSDFQEFFEKIDDKLTMERWEYIETVIWRGKYVPVFLDDYGQCLYCIFDNDVLSFGTYNDNYEDEIKSLIEEQKRKNQ